MIRINSQICTFIPFTVPSEAPINLRVSELSSSSISVSWRPPVLQSRNGQLRYYNVYFTETQLAYYENGTVLPLASMNGTLRSENLTYIINMLHPSYQYSIKVAAATETGLGPYSEEESEILQQDSKSLFCTVQNNELQLRPQDFE